MIKKYKQYIKESILDKLKGPSKEEVWSSLGYDRTFDTPEEFFLEVIKDIKIRPQTKYPDSVFWEKDGEIIFQQDLKNMGLWVKYNTIWKIFENIFNMKYTEIKEFIKSVVEEHLNWKGFTPLSLFYGTMEKVEEHLNWKGFTPIIAPQYHQGWWKNI